MLNVRDDLPKAAGEIMFNYSVAHMTRFKTGGLAQVFFSPIDTNDLSNFIKKAPKDMAVHIIGFGSNLLIRDGMLNGILIRLQSENFTTIQHIGDGVFRCGAFASNIAIAKAAESVGVAGFEFLFGIPGSIGGGTISNAGCFGGEISDILKEIEVINKISGEKSSLKVEECGLSYRKSTISDEFIITSVLIEGNSNCDGREIQKKMDYIKTKKDNAQPTYTKTAGSTFKNPIGDTPAWKLVVDAGCQGMSEGGAIVSNKHANFIINEDNASSKDIEDLGEAVRLKVYEKFGIMLEYEIKILGSRA